MKPARRAWRSRHLGTAWTIASVRDAVDAVCHSACAALQRRRLEAHCFAVDLLLREFLNNAIVHGHRTLPRKRVHARMQVTGRWIILHVADRGPGFDWRARRREPPDETATSGRGMAIGAAYADELRFSARGNAVTLGIKRPPRGNAVTLGIRRPATKAETQS